MPSPALPAMTLPSPAFLPPMTASLAAMRTPAPPLPSSVTPSDPTPMWLPCTRWPPVGLLLTSMPCELLPEITLRAAAVLPPTVVALLLVRKTPTPVLPSAAVPLAFRPTMLPCTVAVTLPPT